MTHGPNRWRAFHEARKRSRVALIERFRLHIIWWARLFQIPVGQFARGLPPENTGGAPAVVPHAASASAAPSAVARHITAGADR